MRDFQFTARVAERCRAVRGVNLPIELRGAWQPSAVRPQRDGQQAQTLFNPRGVPRAFGGDLLKAAELEVNRAAQGFAFHTV